MIFDGFGSFFPLALGIWSCKQIVQGSIQWSADIYCANTAVEVKFPAIEEFGCIQVPVVRFSPIVVIPILSSSGNSPLLADTLYFYHSNHGKLYPLVYKQPQSGLS